MICIIYLPLVAMKDGLGAGGRHVCVGGALQLEMYPYLICSTRLDLSNNGCNGGALQLETSMWYE